MARKASTKKEIEKRDKKIRRLYALIWVLACPLVYVIVLLLGFHQINIVYWTLLVVPVLLAIWNVRQVPPSYAQLKRRVQAEQEELEQAASSQAEGTPEGETAPQEAPAPEEPAALPEGGAAEDSALDDGEEYMEGGIKSTERAKRMLLALRVPAIIAAPILITLIVHIIVTLSR